MAQAIGMIEMKTVSAGLTASDVMVKTASVKLLEAQVVCPGKYIALITGELSAVNSAIEAASVARPIDLIDTFILGNPHESIFPAIYGTCKVEQVRALGILETFDVACLIEAADTAAKTAEVTLIELRLAKGMCGKSYLTLTGEVAAVEASVSKAASVAASKGMYLDSSVIAHPDPQICRSIL
jgi:microcompartment protein CcmL/EutN